MSNSSVSGPYASAVSIKFTPSSTARRKTLRAFSRSGGQPHMPSPVRRIAPNPSRLTGRSPPMLKVEFVTRRCSRQECRRSACQKRRSARESCTKKQSAAHAARNTLVICSKGFLIHSRSVRSYEIFSRSKFERSSTRTAPFDRNPICRSHRLRLQLQFPIWREKVAVGGFKLSCGKATGQRP